jgi:energy-coupling factor transporter ATP-binding protein EcfA2
VPAIETTGLTKDYGSGRGLFDLDLEIEQGEVFGFLGPNGAGKSTTMRLLMALVRPTAGGAKILRVGHAHRRRSDSPAGRILAGRARVVSEAPRRRDARLPRRTSRRPGRAGSRCARGALRGRAGTADPGALDREPAEARVDPGFHARARAPHPRRADHRPRSARAAQLPRVARRGRVSRSDRVPVLAQSFRGRERRATRRNPPRRPADRRRLRRQSPPGGSPTDGNRVRHAGGRARVPDLARRA